MSTVLLAQAADKERGELRETSPLGSGANPHRSTVTNTGHSGMSLTSFTFSEELVSVEIAYVFEARAWAKRPCDKRASERTRLAKRHLRFFDSNELSKLVGDRF